LIGSRDLDRNEESRNQARRDLSGSGALNNGLRTNLIPENRSLPDVLERKRIGGDFQEDWDRIAAVKSRNQIVTFESLFPMTSFPQAAIRPEPLAGSKGFERLTGAIFLLALGIWSAREGHANDLNDLKPADLYRTTNVWSVHLQFTADQWQQMEPKGEPGGFFGGGPRGGARGGFGPGMLAAPAFMRDGDVDHDAKLTPTEFERLAAKWFAQWDKDKTGKLDADQLRTGLSATFVPPGFGPRGRGPRMNLQGPEGKRNGLSSAAGIEFEYVHADLQFADQWIKDVAVRYKGNGTFMQSRDSLKRSLKVDVSKYVKGRRVAGVSKLNLHNNVTDASWMNEVLSHKLFRDADVPAPRTAYARVYITVPGKFEREYFGLYSMVEDVNAKRCISEVQPWSGDKTFGLALNHR
jgi:hypothetical protein